MQRHLLCALVAALLLALVVPCAGADEYVVIESHGAPTFLYGGYSYVPLKSAADFVGAALLWDSLKNRGTLTYNGREVGLVVDSPDVRYRGGAVAMPVAPIVVDDRVFVPALVFDRYLGVPLRWDHPKHRLMMRGRHGWGYYQVAPAPPPPVIAVIERHGPPPWAPAHGRRRHEPAYYVTAPFVYSGVTYVPLRDAASLVGAALLWDSLKGRAVLTYDGREIGLVVGSPTVVYGGRPVVLAAAPVVVHGAVYVPVDFCQRYLKVPVQHDRGVLKLKGPKGWHEFKVASRPPGPVSHGRESRPRSTSRERPRPAQQTLTQDRRAGRKAKQENRGRAEGKARQENRGRAEGKAKQDNGDRAERGRDPFKQEGGRVEREPDASRRGRDSDGGKGGGNRGGEKGRGKGRGRGGR
jgi:hypothetical protein